MLNTQYENELICSQTFKTAKNLNYTHRIKTIEAKDAMKYMKGRTTYG